MNTYADADACIYHVCSRSAAIAARAGRAYRAPSLDTKGFIHCAQSHQVRGVLERFYAGQADLALLVVDPTLLTSALKYEAASALPVASNAAMPALEERFPHLYGPLDSAAILDIVDAARFSGRPVHPDTAALLRHYRFARLPVESTLYQSSWRADVETADGGPAGTAMIGMYAETPESLSCFHRLDHDEVWHFYGGDPFVLYLLLPDGTKQQVLMGPDPLAGHQVQCVVARGVWQAGCLVPGGRHALFGCTMAPGFTGSCFEAGIADELCRQYPQQAALIRRLSVNADARRMPDGFAS